MSIYGIGPRFEELLMRFIRLGGRVAYSDVKDIYWNRLSYYMVMKSLEENGIITNDGVNDKNEKVRKLTENGVVLADVICRIKKETENRKKGKS